MLSRKRAHRVKGKSPKPREGAKKDKEPKKKKEKKKNAERSKISSISGGQDQLHLSQKKGRVKEEGKSFTGDTGNRKIRKKELSAARTRKANLRVH